MTIQEIIDGLVRCSGAFPSEEVAEAVRLREEITPELLSLLEYSTANIEEIANQDDYMGHIFAMYLLAEFRETRACPLLASLARAEWQHVDMVLGDIVTEDLGRILASVCGDDIGLICRMIEDANLNEYVRGAALESLVVLVAQGVNTQDDIIGYFRSLFNGKLEREWGYFWSALVSKCCSLHADELMDEIEQAFADGIIDTMFISWNSVKRRMAEDRDMAMERLRKEPRRRFVEDAASELSNWSCFRPVPQPSKTPTVQQYWTAAQVRTTPKVGRNAPCPCGSGKKYKKCCGG